MNIKLLRTAALALAMMAAAANAVAQSGGNYNLGWNTTDGGGGNCAGAKFKLSGTVGQPDTGFCTGSTYVQQGGFLPAFQKDVGPPLSMTRSMGNPTFTWSGTCTGFVLEGAPNVNGPWIALGSGMLSGGTYQLTLSPPTP